VRATQRSWFDSLTTNGSISGLRIVALVAAWVALSGGTLATGGTPVPRRQARRVVDVVTVGDARSEREHEYAGQDVVEGVVDGKPFRQARGWLRYSLTTYDDTQVTVRCIFRGSEGQSLPFELLVEGRPILTHTFRSPSAAPVTVEFPIPMQVTRDKTIVSVTIRAVNGLTPGLLTLQTVQEHLEQPAW
jgi:hypothetical protein